MSRSSERAIAARAAAIAPGTVYHHRKRGRILASLTYHAADMWEYGGRDYPSPSAAAKQAAVALGMNPSQNGWVFWQIEDRPDRAVASASLSGPGAEAQGRMLRQVERTTRPWQRAHRLLAKRMAESGPGDQRQSRKGGPAKRDPELRSNEFDAVDAALKEAHRAFGGAYPKAKELKESLVKNLPLVHKRIAARPSAQTPDFKTRMDQRARDEWHRLQPSNPWWIGNLFSGRHWLATVVAHGLASEMFFVVSALPTGVDGEYACYGWARIGPSTGFVHRIVKKGAR